MNNWVELAKRSKELRAAKEAPPELIEEIQPFKLLEDQSGWKRLPWDDVKRITIGELCSQSYLFKVPVGYLCGNQLVWDKLADKPRSWIRGLCEELIRQHQRHNQKPLKVECFFHHSWDSFLLVLLSMKILKARLVLPEGA